MCHILYAVIRHFHAQVVVSCVLSSCLRLLNKTSAPIGSVPDCLACIFRNCWLGIGGESTMWGCVGPGALFPSPISSSCVTQRKGEIILISGRGILAFFSSSFPCTWHYKRGTLWSYLTFLYVLESARTEVKYTSHITSFDLRILFLKWKNWTGWFYYFFSELYKMDCF